MSNASNAPAKVQNTRYEIEINIQPAEPMDEDDLPQNVGVCGYHYLQEARRRLRGRFDASHLLKHDTSVEFKAFADAAKVIPGERVFVDLHKGEWGIYDPLYKPEEGSQLARLADKIKLLMAEYFTGGNTVRFKRPVTNKLAGPSDAKNILYWMARAVKGRHATIVQGTPKLPDIETIKEMKGKRRVDYGTNTSDPETKKILSQYEFEVA